MQALEQQRELVSPPGHPLELLRHRPFLLLWLVQTLSQTGQNMVHFSLLVLVRGIVERHGIGQLNTAIGLTVLSFALPAVLVSPLAGVVADRFDRRVILVLTNALRGVAVAGLLLLEARWSAYLALALLYALTFLSGVVGQFFGPALASALPDVAPRRQIIQANAFFNLTFTVSQIVGFAAAGPLLVKLVGLHPLLSGIVAVFALCALVSLALPPSCPPARALPAARRLLGQLLGEIVEGIHIVRTSPHLVKAIASLTIATATYLMVAVLGPGYVTVVLGLPAEDIAYLVVPAGLGVVLGTVLVPRVAGRFGSLRTIDLGLALGGLLLGCLAVTGWQADGTAGGASPAAVALTAGLAGLLGIVNGMVLAPSQSLLQAGAPEHVRGRVYAAFFTVSNTVAFVPVFFSGALADLLGIAQVLGGIGLVLLGVGGWQLLAGSRQR
jgi:MFS family permease